MFVIKVAKMDTANHIDFPHYSAVSLAFSFMTRLEQQRTLESEWSYDRSRWILLKNSLIYREALA